MPKLSAKRIPSYRLHKQSGQAVVTLDSHDFLLGPYGSKTSKAEYDRRITEWIAAGRRLPADPNTLTIINLCAAFRRHALA